MIRIKKPRRGPGILRTKGAERTARDRALLLADPAAELTFDSSVYGHETVRDALCAAQHNKCAFCERRVECAVEHYRPKSALKQADGEPMERPGYWWLAYRWENLLLACDPCNSRHKRELFPLELPSRRARKPEHSLRRESPLLLNPAETDPALHITFDSEFAKPVDGSKVGVKTIEVLRLNDRVPLVESRRDRLIKIRDVRNLLDLQLAARSKLTTSGQPVPRQIVKAIAFCRARLRTYRADDAEFAAMARCEIQRAGEA
jgi:hypothetical protein